MFRRRFSGTMALAEWPSPQARESGPTKSFPLLGVGGTGKVYRAREPGR
jgi:hypothetical protein